MNYAVKYNHIEKPDRCQHPGCESTGRVTGHHHKGYDRDKWLDVAWLCDKHHAEAEYDTLHERPQITVNTQAQLTILAD